MRALGKEIMNDLKEGGRLASITGEVKKDSSLCLELRGRYINVYYRGGSLMKVEKCSKGYKTCFDKNYFKDLTPPDLPQKVFEKAHVKCWLDAWSVLKNAMDHSGKLNLERDIQQLLLRSNNMGAIARFTDYYSCDIEYDVGKHGGKFDCIAVHWPSDERDERNNKDRRLAIMEIKHGDGSLDGKSGLHAHVEAVNRFLNDREKVTKFKEDMCHVFNQKRELGLISCDTDLEKFSDDPPFLLLALSDHNPYDPKLFDLLKSLPKSPHAELRIASA